MVDWTTSKERIGWIARCASRLRGLRPGLEVSQACMLAEDLWAAHRDLLAPDEAARLLAAGAVEV